MEFPWLLMICVSLGGTALYLVFMIFLPEWVGISKREKPGANESKNSDTSETKSN